MYTWRTFLVFGILLVPLIAGPTYGQPVYHDAQLNWDFRNFTGQIANDFEVIVSNPSYNPNVNDPAQVYTTPGAPVPGFPTAARQVGDFDPINPGNEVKIRWSGANINPNNIAHVGLNLAGAGQVLGASWTFENQLLAWKVPITFERTRVTPTTPTGIFDLNMELNVASTFFTDPDNPFFPNAAAGWTNIRTFIDIPEDELSLLNINSELDLATLASYATAPRVGGPSGALINPTDTFLFNDASIFDVYVGATSSASPQFESLLVADVVSQGTVIGRFWNLNVQSPEPNSLALLALGALLVTRRRRLQ